MGYLNRYIEDQVSDDLNRKMVFIGGPRQSGKTTLAKHLCSVNHVSISERYWNWDAPVDREQIMNEQFPAGSGLLVLDEIHKYSRWRQVLKGLYDKRGDVLKILVTGSARLDHYRRGGDSLQGRYHYHRLFPFTLKELESSNFSTLEQLLKYGGFPEPFLASSERFSRRWSREYRSRLVRGDLRDLENVRDLDSIERMVLHLPNLVGSPLSLNGLREDLQVSHQSVSRWIAMLENMYMIFRIYPFGAPRIRAVKKEAKHYHMDWTVVSDSGYRFENLVACHLLKWCCVRQDRDGCEVELRYFRDVDKREVDFVLVEDGNPIHFIEVKQSDRRVTQPLRYLKKRFPEVNSSQIYLGAGPDVITREGIRICPAHKFLAQFI